MKIGKGFNRIGKIWGNTKILSKKYWFSESETLHNLQAWLKRKRPGLSFRKQCQIVQ